MIRSFNHPSAADDLRPHFTYRFIHQDMLLCAYDEIGRSLERLRREIDIKYAAMLDDKTRRVYYVDLIQNLERQFSRMIVEGLNGGSVTILQTAAVTVEERSVA